MKNAKSKILTIIEATTVSRKFPANVTVKDRPLFENLLSARIKDIVVIELLNVHLTAQGTIFKRMVPIADFTLSNDDGEIVPYSLWSLIKIRLFYPSIRLGKGTDYLVIDNIYSHTYYHWLTEALPRLFLVKDKIPESTLLLPDGHDQRFHNESLALFGINRVEWLRPKVRYFVPHLIASTQIGRMANYNPLVIREMAAYIKSRVQQPIEGAEKIYIRRSNTSERMVINESEVEICLEGLGFKMICFEDHSFAAQVCMMRQCKILIGIHGAGLANMIFMESGGKVMELRKSDGGENYFYFSLASAVNLDYYYQFCDADDGNKSVQEADIIVDLEKLKGNLKHILS